MDFQAIIKKNHPELDVTSFSRITGGWASDTFEVNGEFIFRFPRHANHKFDLQKEIRLLPSLSKILSVKIPNFEFIDQNIPYVGYKKIQGVPIMHCDLTSDKLAKQMASVLLEMHSFPPEKALELGVLKLDWKQDYANFFELVRNKTFNLLEEPVRAKAEAVFDEFLNNADNFSFTPILVHRDLAGDAHILCDTETNVINGIIDWEDACIGDPAIDFTGLYWDCGEKFTKAILSHYEDLGGNGPETDRTFWQRNLFYYQIGHFHTIMYGLEINNENHLREGIETINKIFGDIS